MLAIFSFTFTQKSRKVESRPPHKQVLSDLSTPWIFLPGQKIPMPGSYLRHPHVPVIGTTQLPQFAQKARNHRNQGPGLNYYLSCAVIGPFIITTSGILGVTIETEGNNPKKWPKTTLNKKKNPPPGPPQAHHTMFGKWQSALVRDAGEYTLRPSHTHRGHSRATFLGIIWPPSPGLGCIERI